MLNGRVLERSVGNNLDRTRCAFDLGRRLIGIEHADHDDVGCSWGWGLVLAVTLGESGIGREKRSGKGAGRKQKSGHDRSEEHTSELQSLMRISYAVFCLKNKTNYTIRIASASDNTTCRLLRSLTSSTIDHT